MSDYSKFSDNTLTTLLKAGDHAAFTAIYNRFFGVLYLHALKRLRDEGEAKDIVQELFASLWNKREAVLAKTNLSNYLYTAIRNGVFNYIAHQKVASKYMQTLPSYLEEGECLTDHLARERQLAAIIEKEIYKLPEKMRIVFELSRKEGLSHKEIAERLGISEETVKSQIKNSLRQLKSKLSLFAYLLILLNF